jgi:dihydrolipoamide dehydrogenase
MTRSRSIVLAAIAVCVAVIIAVEPGQYLNLSWVKSQQHALQTIVDEHALLSIGGYFFLYVIITALSIPGAAIMTLIAGALFGVFTGTLVVSFASTLGATCAFLLSRYLFRETVENRFRSVAASINDGIARDGGYYLFTLRLVPIFPFFAINMAMALTRLKTITYAWVSQIGMLPGTIVYVNAGTQLGQIESTADVLSPALIGSFVLLGIFPLLTKKFLDLFNRRQRLKKFRRPAHFDANLVVIGAGSAGLVTAYVAAAARAKVFLIEQDRMGGDCLNTGCVPSKALIRSARVAGNLRRASEFGLQAQFNGVDFAQVMQRVNAVIGRIEPHDSVGRYTQLGVDCVSGEASIESPFEVRVGDRRIATRNIVIATGGKPRVPDIPGIELTHFVTSDTLWDLQELPKSLLVLGGGPIGCEMAQAFRQLGSQVTLVERAPQVLSREDPEVSKILIERFRADGIDVRTGQEVTGFIQHGDRMVARCTDNREIEFDRLLVALGRRAATDGLGLEKLGISLNANGTIPVDNTLQTTCPGVFACGDVTGPYQLTHAAGYQGWFCAMNALFGGLKKFKTDYSVMPWAIFTDPEVARVGLTESEATAAGIAYETTRYGIDDLDRAIADSEAHGFVKILTPPGKDKILGVTIVGPHAGDLIVEFVIAMQNGLGLRKVLNTIHIYPTLSEANRFAAGEWQKAHLPQRILQFASGFHKWRRK